MIVCDLLRCLALGTIPLAVVLGHVTVAQLYLTALVEGTAAVFFTTAATASLPRVVPRAQLPRATALAATASSIATLLGPGVGGLVMGVARTIVAGATLAFLVDSLSYLASALTLGHVRTPFQSACERYSIYGHLIR